MFALLKQKYKIIYVHLSY